MQSFVEFVIRGLVDRPEDVRVTPVQRHGVTVYEVEVGPGDAGKIIGRRGATIQAIRSILQIGAMKAGKRCQLELVED